MIDDLSNCPYSYCEDFPHTFLYPSQVAKYVNIKDRIAEMDELSKAILYQLILMASNPDIEIKIGP